MRVIAGKSKGHTLKGPKLKGIRPAIDKVKGAIFNILGPLEGERVLDLFAGTGSIGIEALSRGASRAVFVEFHEEGLRLIRENLKKTRLEGMILQLKVPRDLGKLHPQGVFDLIFVDPPYDRNLVNPALHGIAQEKLLADQGMIVIEHSPRESVDLEGLPFEMVSQRKYGQTRVTFLKNKALAPGDSIS